MIVLSRSGDPGLVWTEDLSQAWGEGSLDTWPKGLGKFSWSRCDPSDSEVGLRIRTESGKELLRSRWKLTRFWVGCLGTGLGPRVPKGRGHGDSGLGSPSVQLILLRAGPLGSGEQDSAVW